MAKSNYPNGFVHGVTIRGIPILNTYSKNVYYVDSVNGSNGYDGTFNWPKASVSYLITSDIVSAGDRIICKPGHVETIASAAAFDIAGICVIFDGEGTSKSYINFTTVDACLSITAAGITLINPKFVTGIDAVAKGVNVAAADFAMYNVEYHDAPAMASTIQVLTTSAADRMEINGYRYFVSTTGTQKTDGIKTVAGTGIVIKNVQIVGDFSTAPINLSTAAINISLEGLDLNNVSAVPHAAMNIHANTTGFADDVKCRIASGTTYVSSTAKIQWGTMCQGYNTDGSGGTAIGAAADITAAVDSVGVQASVVDSEVQSVGIRVSVGISTAASVGIQTSTVQSTAASVGIQVSTVQSKADSVGVQTSLGISVTVSTSERVGSVGTQASAVDSRVVSVGTSASTVISQASSIATGAVSIGTQVSTTSSQVTSAATSVGTGVSTVSSQVTSAATSVGIGVSTVSSQTTSAATSVGIGVSTTSSQTTSAATSVGIGVSTAVSTAESVGVMATTLLIRSIRQNSVNLVAANLTGTTTRFTVSGGPILVRHLGMLVTTAIPAGANTLLFSFTPTDGAATNLSGATDTASAGIRQLFIVDGVKATATVKTTDVGIGIASAHEVGMPLILCTGIIQTIFSAGPPATGAVTIFMEWEPLTSASAVA